MGCRWRDVPDHVTTTPEVTFQNVAAGQVTAAANGIEEFRQLAERAAQMFASRRQPVRHYEPDGAGARIEVGYEGVLATDISIR